RPTRLSRGVAPTRRFCHHAASGARPGRGGIGMPSAQRTITIDRPPDQVFAFFTDPTNDPKWRKGVKEISAEGPIGVGTKVHQVVAGPGGRSIAADIQVDACEPPTRYAFHAIAGPARPVGEYLFTPSGGG